MSTISVQNLAPTQKIGWTDGHAAKCVSTVSALGSLAAQRDGQVIELLGYYAAGDGGGQTLVYHSTGRPTADDGFYFDGPGADDYFEAVDKSVADVRRFGIVVDGTDQAAEFQAMLTAAAGLIVSVPGGCTVGLSAAVDIPAGTSVVGPGTIRKLNAGSAAQSLLVLSGNNAIENLTIDGNSDALVGADSTQHHDITVEGSNNTVRDCRFSDAGGSSISGSSAIQDVRIENCTFDEWTDHAVYFSTSVSGVSITGNQFRSTAGGETIKFRNDGRMVSIASNTFATYGRWVMLQHSIASPTGIADVAIAGNAGTCQTTPFLCNCDASSDKVVERVSITGNSISLDSSITAVQGIINMDWLNVMSSRHISISGNIFRNLVSFGCSGDAGDYAAERVIDGNVFVIDTGKTIASAPMSFYKCRNIAVRNNIFRFDAFSYGNYLAYIDDLSDVTFEGNTFDAGAIWLASLADADGVTVRFRNNTIRTLSRRPFTAGAVTGSSLVVWDGNDVTQSASYPWVFDEGAVTDETKYAIGLNSVNGLPIQRRYASAVTAAAHPGTAIPADSPFVTITSSDANHIAILPAASPGMKVEGYVGANGCEFYASGSSININGVVCSATNEAAMPANSLWKAECVGASDWILTYTTSAGAAGATITPDAR